MLDITTFDILVKSGVPTLALILLYLLAKHHISSLREHRKDARESEDTLRALELAYRNKIEDLYKGQLKVVQDISATMTECTLALETVKESLNKRK